MTSPFGLQVNEKGAATEEEVPGTTINEERDALGPALHRLVFCSFCPFMPSH